MGRRRKQSAFEDWIEVAAMLPWQAAVLLAVIIYFVLHHYATAEIASPTSVTQLGANVASQLGKALAMFGQYLLPLAFIIGAGISAYGRSRRTQLFEDASASKSVAALNGMSWQEFEMLVGEAFRRDGYSVIESGGGGADGGVDLVLGKGGEKFLVQCKQWKAFKVGVPTVRELYGVMAATGAVGGFVVTSGVFTRDAKEFAEGRNINLVDGARLKNFIRKSSQTAAMQPFTPRISPIATVAQFCPKCGSDMVKRTAKHGANAGKMFWGCANFPQCRGVVAID